MISYCCICGKELKGYGHNAKPVQSGYCCDECNIKFVIPARLRDAKVSEEKLSYDNKRRS